MIATKTTVVLIKESAFKGKDGKIVPYKQLCVEDDNRLYLVNASAENPCSVGDAAFIVFDGKKYALLEYKS